MAKLKLNAIADDKPVKVSLDLPASLHRDLVAYAEVLSRESGQQVGDPMRLIVPMLQRFVATDRVLARTQDKVVLRCSGAGRRRRTADERVSTVVTLAASPPCQ